MCWHQLKLQKLKYFWHFNDKNAGVNHDNQTYHLISHVSHLFHVSVGTFHFCISGPSKFNFTGSPLCIMFWSVKHTFTYYFLACCWHIYLFSTWIFLNKNFYVKRLVYNMFCSKFEINFVPIPWKLLIKNYLRWVWFYILLKKLSYMVKSSKHHLPKMNRLHYVILSKS